MAADQSIAQLSTEILRQVLDGAPADRTIKRVFRRERQLDDQQRKTIASSVYRVALHRARLAYPISEVLDTYPQQRAELLLATLLISDDEVAAPKALAQCGMASDEPASTELLEALRSPPALPDSPIERLALTRSVPVFIAEMLLETYSFEEADLLMAHLNQPGPITLRARSHPFTRDQVAAQLLADGIETRVTAHSPWGLHVIPPAQGKANLWGSEAYRQGLFEVQDEGSQLIALACGARQDECVVDYCAGRGGKTLALAASMENVGRLVATDVDSDALRDLQTRLQRAGVTCVESRHLVDAPDQSLPAALVDLEFQADLVLVDAPCSSLGAWRRGPHQRWALKADEMADWPVLQKSVLARASRLVRPGGRLLYATCTLLPAENQEVRAAFLQSHPDFHPQPLPIEPAQGSSELLLAPHLHGCDGFYLAHFGRVGA